MQEAILNQEIANLNLKKVAALQQKRTLAFVNHFAVTTVQFFNNFMKQCERKLMNFERKLEKVEASLVLLETRLSSIPEVNSTPTTTETNQEINTVTEPGNPAREEPTPESAPEATISPEYERFIKMIQVGVPLQAVKLKVSLEGLDPSVLEDC